MATRRLNKRTFVAWVEPIASRDSEARAELLRFSKSIPDNLWASPSSVPGWTCKDILAHLAGDTGKWFATILNSVLQGKRLEEPYFGRKVDVDGLNRSDVEARRYTAIQALIEEIGNDGRIHDEQLSLLKAEHEHHLLAHYDVSLGEFLRNKEAGKRSDHDRVHLQQLEAEAERLGN